MQTLKMLSEIIGVSGYEESVSAIIEELLSKKGDISIKKDRMGNLICNKPGDNSLPKIMIIAHMDEVGFQVMEVDESGNATLKTLGNIKTWNVLNQCLSTSDEKKTGIVICDEPEGIKPYEFEKIRLLPTKGNLQIGDVFGFKSHFIETEKQFVGKAIDNRLSCYLLYDFLSSGINNKASIDFVFTVQEEIGMRGARVAITELMPDIIIDLDTSPVGERNSLKLGQGVGIKLSDSIGVSDQTLVSLLEKIAIEKNIPFQREVSDCGTSELIITNEHDTGARRVGISIPCQNIHTAMTIANKSDFASCKLLVRSFLEMDFSIDI